VGIHTSTHPRATEIGQLLLDHEPNKNTPFENTISILIGSLEQLQCVVKPNREERERRANFNTGETELREKISRYDSPTWFELIGNKKIHRRREGGGQEFRKV
jgi:hypothetical protein